MTPDWISECGSIELYNADCAEVFPKLRGIECVITDPPYGKKPSRSIKSSFGQPLSRSFDTDATRWDIKPNPEFIRRLAEINESIIWGGQYFSPLPPSNCWLIWDKLNGKNPFADCEMAWTNLTKNNKVLRYQWIGAHARRIEPAFHPTQKPVAVMDWALSFVDAKSITDPFMGSGSTGIACVKAGRNFRGIEIDPGYFETAKRRIQAAISEKSETLRF